MIFNNQQNFDDCLVLCLYGYILLKIKYMNKSFIETENTPLVPPRGVCIAIINIVYIKAIIFCLFLIKLLYTKENTYASNMA